MAARISACTATPRVLCRLPASTHSHKTTLWGPTHLLQGHPQKGASCDPGFLCCLLILVTVVSPTSGFQPLEQNWCCRNKQPRQLLRRRAPCPPPQSTRGLRGHSCSPATACSLPIQGGPAWEAMVQTRRWCPSSPRSLLQGCGTMGSPPAWAAAALGSPNPQDTGFLGPVIPGLAPARELSFCLHLPSPTSQALSGPGPARCWDSEIRHGHCPSGSSRSCYFKGEDRPPLLPCPAHPGLSCRVSFPSFSKLRNILRRDSFPTAEPNIRDASGLCLHPEKHHVSTSQNGRKVTAKHKLLRDRR